MIQLAIVVLVLVLCISIPAMAVTPTKAEVKQARDLAGKLVSADAAPFSFVYDGKRSRELLKNWDSTATSSTAADGSLWAQRFSFTDPETGLLVSCVATVYGNFPTVEWTLWFKNTGRKDTPIISDIKALDYEMKGTDFILHHWAGEFPWDLQPEETVVKPGDKLGFTPIDGRSTDRLLPNYNIETPSGGMIAVLGWPGKWASRISREGNKLHIEGGQETCHFKLHPGEEIRTPRVVLQFYEGGDWIRAQNIWRRWMMAYNMPKPGGKLPEPMICAGNAGTMGYWRMTEENQKSFFDRYIKEGPKLDVWWMDLGWFEVNTQNYQFSALYEPAVKRFPNQLKPVADMVHAKGMKLMNWFEPEHFYPGPANWLVNNKPEWLLKAPPGHEQDTNQLMPLLDRNLFDLSNPEAVEWCTNNILRVMKEQGIDYYRHDFNIEPLIFWRARDTEDRQGITEAKYCQGFLKFFDNLLAARPDMLIDNCASGGRRNDIDTMRRSVPLWRSDSGGDPEVEQAQTYSWAFWQPYFGHAMNNTNTYTARSTVYPSTVMDENLDNKDLSLAGAKQIIDNEWRTMIAPNYYGDYYPIFPATKTKDVWVAWQFDRPEDGQGVIQAFRRAENNEPTKRLKLRGLEPKATYLVTDADSKPYANQKGSELMDKGLEVTIDSKPGAVTIAYTKAGR